MVNSHYSELLLNSSGWIAELGDESSPHLFGGNQWCFRENDQIAVEPHLLLDLDFDDVLSINSQSRAFGSVPICSYVNADIGVASQHYRFDSGSMEVEFVRSELGSTMSLGAGDFPNPLPRKRIRLREMTSEEGLEDESTYWEACDSFVGGESFIRVLGRPLWLQSPLSPNCINCAKQGIYTCSIGYQNYVEYVPFIENMPFFIGEVALYFFLCADCKIVSVYPQST